MSMLCKVLSTYKGKPTFKGFFSILCVVFAVTWTHSARATPCSCWNSGTTVYMGAKCHAAWEDIDHTLDECLKDARCEAVATMLLGIPFVVKGISLMEKCRKLCNATQKSGASGYTGNEWWYADPTAYKSCLKQNPNVLKNWLPK